MPGAPAGPTISSSSPSAFGLKGFEIGPDLIE